MLARALGTLHRILTRTRGRLTRRLRAQRTRRAAAEFVATARSRGNEPLAILLVERLGDIVAASAVVALLREDLPGRELAWVGRGAYRDVALRVPGITTFLEVECYGELATLLDAVADWRLIDLNLNGKTCGCCPGTWKNRTGQAPANTENYYDFGPLAQAFAAAGGVAWRERAPGLMPSHGGGEESSRAEPYVVVHSESEEAARSWTAEGWRSVVQFLLRETALRIVHVGARPAPWLLAGPRVRDLAGQTNPTELLALVERAALFIGIDSGLAHIANAYRRPGLVLLGRYRVFASYLPYTGYYGAGESGALLVRHLLECVELPTEVVDRALRTVCRRLRSAALPVGAGGPWDVRFNELPFAAAEPAGRGEVCALLVVDADETRWLERWEAAGGRRPDVAIVVPTTHCRFDHADSRVAALDQLEALGCRFALCGELDDATLAEVAQSHRYLRFGGVPVRFTADRDRWRIEWSQLTPASPPELTGGGDMVFVDAASATQWLLVDRRGRDATAADDLAASTRRIGEMLASALPTAAPGDVVEATRDGHVASIDRVARRPDGRVARASGWVFLKRTGRPPDLMGVAENHGAGYRLRSVVRFTRLERPDVARDHGLPSARFCGWSLAVADQIELAAPAFAFLVFDSGSGIWHRLDLQ